MQRRKLFYIGEVLILLLCILVGCTPGGQGKKKEKQNVDYLIGVVKENAPYYYEGKDGSSQGYYADFVSELSKKHSFTYDFVPVDALAAEELLSNKEIDAFIGVFTTKTGKEKTFLESKPFHTSKLCVLAAPNSGISSLKEIQGEKIAAVSGAQEEAAAKSLANKYEGQSVTFASTKDAITDIQDGYSQILVVDEDYYKSQEETFKNWVYLKRLENFQNDHKLFAENNNLVY